MKRPHRSMEPLPRSSPSDALNDLNETADATRIRLARSFLNSARRASRMDDEEEEEEADEKEERSQAREELSRVLRERSGNGPFGSGSVRVRSGEWSEWDESPLPRLHRLHRLSSTCVALSADDEWAYSGSKDGTVVEFCVERSCKGATWKAPSSSSSSSSEDDLVGHASGVSAVARSSDSRYLASGSVDGIMRVHDSRLNPNRPHSLIHSAAAHKLAIRGMKFRDNTSTLYTCSADRTVKAWDLSQTNPYVETLYGHTDSVNAIDASASRAACVTVGSDKTARYWRIEQETQLLFRAESFSSSLDSVAMINDTNFITGGEDGNVQFWATSKKKPLDMLRCAHNGTWITALACIRQSDICGSGASDGFLNLYSISSQNKLQLFKRIPTPGYINALQFASRAHFVVGAIGQEHRCGRWLPTIRTCKNGIAIIPLPNSRKT